MHHTLNSGRGVLLNVKSCPLSDNFYPFDVVQLQHCVRRWCKRDKMNQSCWIEWDDVFEAVITADTDWM